MSNFGINLIDVKFQPNNDDIDVILALFQCHVSRHQINDNLMSDIEQQRWFDVKYFDLQCIAQ